MVKKAPKAQPTHHSKSTGDLLRPSDGQENGNGQQVARMDLSPSNLATLLKTLGSSKRRSRAEPTSAGGDVCIAKPWSAPLLLHGLRFAQSSAANACRDEGCWLEACVRGDPRCKHGRECAALHEECLTPGCCLHTEDATDSDAQAERRASVSSTRSQPARSAQERWSYARSAVSAALRFRRAGEQRRASQDAAGRQDAPSGARQAEPGSGRAGKTETGV
jgi:hypothetical protein